MDGRSRVVEAKQAEMCRFVIKKKKKKMKEVLCQLPSTIYHASRFVWRSLSRDRCPTNKQPYCYVRRKEGGGSAENDLDSDASEKKNREK